MNRTVAGSGGAMNGCECGAEASQMLGIEVQGVFDGILIWECPYCKGLRPRFPDPADKLHRMALEIIDRWAE